MRILLMDDNPDILVLLTMMVQRALGPESCQIISARDGAEGIALLEAGQTPDLIFTNLRMPHMDGLDFARRMRHNAAWARIPLVVISADQSSRMRQAASDSGANDFVSKPFDFYAIKTTLSRYYSL